MNTLRAQLESLGLDLRPDPGTFAAYQTRAAAGIVQDLALRLEDDTARLRYTLGVMEQERRAGKRFVRRQIQRQEEYLATLARLGKVLASATAHYDPACPRVGAHVAERAAVPLPTAAEMPYS